MSKVFHILLVEDHPGLARNILEYFEGGDLSFDHVDTLAEGRERLLRRSFDALLLDRMLPDGDGMDLCRLVRSQPGRDVPVLMLTARDALEDKLTGFASGADDYLTKPFDFPELEARLRVLLRRRRPVADALRLGPLILDPATRQVFREGREIVLSPTGFALLRLLMEAYPGVLGREEMESRIWGEFPPGSDSLRTHMANLRKALDKPFDLPLIENLYGVGYRLVLPGAS